MEKEKGRDRWEAKRRGGEQERARGRAVKSDGARGPWARPGRGSGCTPGEDGCAERLQAGGTRRSACCIRSHRWVQVGPLCAVCLVCWYCQVYNDLSHCEKKEELERMGSGSRADGVGCVTRLHDEMWLTGFLIDSSCFLHGSCVSSFI